jgi:hypothetical protein
MFALAFVERSGTVYAGVPAPSAGGRGGAAGRGVAGMGAAGRTVFVLGAGFTRAFLPEAPLLTDDYGGAELARRFHGFPHARRLLLQEMERDGSGRLDIERLLARLAAGMPYDADRGAAAELSLLAADLRRALVGRIQGALRGALARNDLLAFARRCLRDGVACLTFNYDDVLDRALFEASADSDPERRWHPDVGYGFVCASSAAVAHAAAVRTRPCRVLLLKLHGSLNWRFRLGAQPPYTIDALVHHEDWSATATPKNEDRAHIEGHLAPDPFLVPPVVTPRDLTAQPVLGRLWSLACRELEGTERVVFLGCSLRPAGLAASFLFRDACAHLRPAQLQAVNLAASDEDRRDVRTAYRQVFPGIPDDRFDFRGAREWARAWCRDERDE